MPKKVTFIGGGSSKFIHELVRDLFTFPALRDATIALMDVDEARVRLTEGLVKKMILDLGLPARVVAGTDRRALLEGSDFVLVTIMVGRFETYALDVDLPAKYGVKQSISDTIGPGGVFRFIRTFPVLQAIADDIRAVAPDAWLLNYSNPMAMNVWGLHAAGFERAVGLCHSIQGTYRYLAEAVGVAPDEVTYTAGGINHVNFYHTLRHGTRDLYPAVLEHEAKILRERPEMTTSFELLRETGYFPAEAGTHQSEYYPYFRRTQAQIDACRAPTKAGHDNDKANAERMAVEVPRMIRGEKPISYARGMEYGAFIVNAMVADEPTLFYGNVPNRGLIDNHLPEAVVEVPCVASGAGIRACRVGRVPEILAALQRAHVGVHRLAVDGALAKDRELIRQALMVDPLTAAVCTLPQIRAMTAELFAANAKYLPGW
ncbi:MAG: alpha-glucosidase/alpha-galactosidase [Spirochaetes bacterium]|nr:alpha-glucosidase/alpha-galactosidase [Spirochaetota bacterium]